MPRTKNSNGKRKRNWESKKKRKYAAPNSFEEEERIKNREVQERLAAVTLLKLQDEQRLQAIGEEEFLRFEAVVNEKKRKIEFAMKKINQERLN